MNAPDSEYLAREKALLLLEVRTAFRGVSRGGGISWAASEIVDNYGSPPVGKPIYHDRDRTWEDLVDDPEWRADPGVGGYHFLDAIGVRYYLPAVMIRCIRSGRDEEDVVGAWLTFHRNSRDYTLQKWSLLDEAQRMAIARFLVYMAAVCRAASGREEESEYWREIFDGFWTFPEEISSDEEHLKSKKNAPG